MWLAGRPIDAETLTFFAGGFVCLLAVSGVLYLYGGLSAKLKTKSKGKRVAGITAMILVPVLLCLSPMFYVLITGKQWQGHEVEYTVTGSATDIRVQYGPTYGGTQQKTVTLPWREVTHVKEYDVSLILYVRARGAGTITCSIRVNGEEQRSVTREVSGQEALFSCNGST